MDTVGGVARRQRPGGSARLAPAFTDQEALATHASRPLLVQAAAEEAMAASVPPRRLLFIDDDPLIRKTLAALLRSAGHAVEEADDGSAGLAILSQRPVDLVLTDLGMPGLSGWEVARAVKSQRPHLPVVLVTGWAHSIAMENPERAFVDAILPKPCLLQEFQAVIGRLTGETACTAPGCGNP